MWIYILTELEEVLQSRGRRLSKTQSTRVKRIVSVVLYIVLEGACQTVVREAFCQLHDSYKPGTNRNFVANMTELGELLVSRLNTIRREGCFIVDVQ